MDGNRVIEDRATRKVCVDGRLNVDDAMAYLGISGTKVVHKCTNSCCPAPLFNTYKLGLSYEDFCVMRDNGHYPPSYIDEDDLCTVYNCLPICVLLKRIIIILFLF